LPLVMLPSLGWHLLRAAGWYVCFPHDQRPSYWTVFRVRLAADVPQAYGVHGQLAAARQVQLHLTRHTRVTHLPGEGTQDRVGGDRARHADRKAGRALQDIAGGWKDGYAAIIVDLLRVIAPSAESAETVTGARRRSAAAPIQASISTLIATGANPRPRRT